MPSRAGSTSVVALVLVAACTPLVPPQSPLPPPIHDPDVARDELHRGDLAGLRGHADKTLAVMIAALEPKLRAKVSNVALDFDARGNEVNAYATCAGFGRPIVAITDGLLEVARRLALAKATDEVYGTERARDFGEWAAHHPGEPAPNDPVYFDDKRTRDRALYLYVDELAFIIGHELAHHYLGHLSCGEANDDEGGGIHVEAFALPIFSQAAELDADTHAVMNTLEAARTHAWSEAGAILLLQFFRSQQSLVHWALAFVLSHPLAEIRLPAVITTADVWRATNGRLPL